MTNTSQYYSPESFAWLILEDCLRRSRQLSDACCLRRRWRDEEMEIIWSWDDQVWCSAPGAPAAPSAPSGRRDWGSTEPVRAGEPGNIMTVWELRVVTQLSHSQRFIIIFGWKVDTNIYLSWLFPQDKAGEKWDFSAVKFYSHEKYKFVKTFKLSLQCW